MQPIIWIHDGAIEYLRKEASRASPLETGGSIVGWINDGQYVVSEIVGPGPNAQHERYRFCPDEEHRNRLIEQHFLLSDGKKIYLGDWHTHPTQAEPSISRLDRHELGRIEEYAAAQIKQPMMVILGGKTEWRIRAWLGVRKKFFGIPYLQVSNVKIRLFKKCLANIEL